MTAAASEMVDTPRGRMYDSAVGQALSNGHVVLTKLVGTT